MFVDNINEVKDHCSRVTSSRKEEDRVGLGDRGGFIKSNKKQCGHALRALAYKAQSPRSRSRAGPRSVELCAALTVSRSA